MNTIPVIVSSCDKYRYLWDIQLQLLNKYWKECPHPIYYLSENSNFPDFETSIKFKNVKFNMEPNGPTDWSYMMKTFLSGIDSDYFIYMQEDYILIDYVNQKELNSLIDYVITNEIDYVRFITSPPGNGISIEINENLFIREITKEQKWRTSLMTAIWKKSTFLELLDGDMNVTPWRFEGISSNNFDKFYCIDLIDNDETDIIPFAGLYGSSNGFGIYPQMVPFLKREELKMLDGSEINYEIRL